MNNITGFEVINVKTNQRIPLVGPRAAVDLTKYGNCRLSFLALASSTPSGCNATTRIRCVQIIRGTQSIQARSAPYSLFSQADSRFLGGIPEYGERKLSACTYTDTACTQVKSGCKWLDVDLIGGNMSKFVVYDADTNKPIPGVATIENNEAVCLPKSGNVNFEATTTSKCMGSVRITLVGTDGKRQLNNDEVDAPFFLYSDNDRGDVFGRRDFLADANRRTNYTLSANPYSDGRKFIQANFTFKNCT